MNFDLSEEQQMLQDSVRRYVDKSYTFEARARLVADAGGFSRETWSTFAEMGWLMAPIPEAYGGLGFGEVETALIAEGLGRGLVLEPYTFCTVFPAAILRGCAGEAQKEALLSALGGGETLVAVAHSEPEARGCVAHVSASATRRSDGAYLLNGRKSLVVAAPMADRIIVVARSAGAVRDEAGISLFVLDPHGPGVRLEPYRLLDGTPAADIVLEDAVVPATALLGEEGKAFAGVQRGVDEAIVSLCAETVGGMEDVIALCAEYLKTRQQFGVPIGSFQALQHRMADMAIELMQARATLHRGLAALADPGLGDTSAVISGCKAQITKSAKFVSAQGIQLHGGYGITEEYRVGHHYRRLVLADAWFGNLDYHLARYAARIQAEGRTMAFA
ncbi:acyl-CoA dehydrogenase family protein [Aromatoleum petrolei]|uniref:Acyl-CoA dehydrogenase n=1 Tax=Aromatoleum petrolei TaxID=76116 RepID=A0ABX1MRK9_9RHOO|nr:acyl-CoA dehydrogenase [Aromatoleum petrolei]NMF88629.1 acyl-CoA dehydrogenase [Aromatoleum petrolei]QTQ34660.1 Putative acyl-CoA dehydrogenase/oxidase [Aromatoleum petrolei]